MALKTQIQTDYPFLAESHYFITSAQTGLGIDALRDYLANLPELAEIDKPFRYAIDRVFSVKGAGTVERVRHLRERWPLMMNSSFLRDKRFA